VFLAGGWRGAGAVRFVLDYFFNKRFSLIKSRNSFIIHRMEPEHNYPLLGRIDDYSLHLKLGEGGQASVYLGSKDDCLYALKIYLPGASKEEAYQL
jgi:hypothetical protein